jgi:predicted 2-oxoglutarate/Fe(II)-dependent dioxygenase YbiX
MRARPDLFDDEFAAFFGVLARPDQAHSVQESYPGFRFFVDVDLRLSRAYGAAPITGQGYRPLWVILDPTMRVLDVIALRSDGRDIAQVLARLDALPRPELHAGFPVQAPVLVLPRVFEPDFCDALVRFYETAGGQESGFMRAVAGKTVGVMDRTFKSRRDAIIEDPAMIRATQQRIANRVVPEIAKVHQFHVTRMERYIVSCYRADESGHFAAHRDNTTPGTAHRRFAVSINLNDDFDGGEVSFPEYGPRGFKAPKGGAVVFSCSLLHAVSRVTRGARFAFLPFLYDDVAAEIRARNAASVVDAPPPGPT